MPSATASTATASTAIGGNPAPGQRGKFMQLPRFRVRILDPVSGAVVIDRLPHVTLEYENIFPQLGMAGSSAIGHFVIFLYHPLTDQYAWHKALYDKLDQMQRVEIYMIEDPDGTGATGDPVFTGIIEDLPKEDFQYRIQGEDSLKLLDLNRTLQADTFTGSTSALITYALKTYQMTNVGDFNTDGSWLLSAFNNDGSWTKTTDQGFASIKNGSSGDGLLFSIASYTNAKYADCFIEAPFHLISASTAASADAAIIAAVADTNNFVLGQALLRFVAAGQYAIDAEIWQKSGGVYARKAVTQNVVTETTPNVQVTVTLQGIQTNATQYTWRVLLNEIDSKCTWVQTVASGSPTGAVGVRNTAGTAYVQHHLVFMSKSNAFQAGNVASGSQQVNQPIPSQANIDLLQLAASTEGNVWRKRPKAGLNNDLIDFAVSVGGDLSGIVRLEENIHIVASQSERNAEPLNTAVLAAGHPAYNNRGLHRWYDIAKMNTRGYVISPAVLPQTSDTFALRQMASNVLLRRKQPTQAKRMTVLRHEDHAELPGQPKPTGLAYRDGDWVEQHEPRKGINHQRVQIMSAKVVGGVATIDLTLDQYPVVTDRLPLVDRLNSAVAAGMLSRSDASLLNPATGVSFDRRLVLPINPYKMRVHLASAAQTFSDNAGPLRVNFDTVDFDTAGGWDSTNNQWIVPISGYYVLSVSLYLNTPTPVPVGVVMTATAYIVDVTTGTNTVYQLQFITSLAAGNPGRLTVQPIASDVRFLNQGDAIQGKVNASQGSAGTWQVVQDPSTYMTAHLFSV